MRALLEGADFQDGWQGWEDNAERFAPR
jgi:hypothetical protein